MIKNIALGLVGIVVVGLAGRALWAWQQVRMQEQQIVLQQSTSVVAVSTPDTTQPTEVKDVTQVATTTDTLKDLGQVIGNATPAELSNCRPTKDGYSHEGETAISFPGSGYLKKITTINCITGIKINRYFVNGKEVSVDNYNSAAAVPKRVAPKTMNDVFGDVLATGNFESLCNYPGVKISGGLATAQIQPFSVTITCGSAPQTLKTVEYYLNNKKITKEEYTSKYSIYYEKGELCTSTDSQPDTVVGSNTLRASCVDGQYGQYYVNGIRVPFHTFYYATLGGIPDPAKK